MSYSSSEPEAQDLGFILPKGTDLIREGDNAITTNALVATGALRAAFNRLRTLEDAPPPIGDHGALTGLGDDDHPQYLNQTRGDGRYSRLGHTHPPTAWAEVTDKPTAFPPSAHVHTPAEVGSVPADDPRLRDTGWRLIAPDNGWTGTLRIRRIGPLVFVRAKGLNGAAAANGNVVTLPTGFTPGPDLPAFGVGNSTGSASAATTPFAAVGGAQNQIIRVGGATSAWANGSASLDFPTSDAWPSTLPGTPA